MLLRFLALAVANGSIKDEENLRTELLRVFPELR